MDLHQLIQNRLNVAEELRQEIISLHTRTLLECKCEICGEVWEIPQGENNERITMLRSLSESRIKWGDLSPVIANCNSCQSVLEG